MIDQDLKDLLAQLMAEQAETQRQQRETDRQLQETDRRLRESKEETDRRLRESKEETDRRLRESKEETDRQQQQTDRLLRNLGKQLGGLGDKFGSFTEGLALPSMRKILKERFGLDNVAPRYTVEQNGRTLELDVFGFTNSDRNVAVVVEVKSHLREEGIDQLLRALQAVPEFMPQHRDKKLYGILAAVSVPENLRARVLKEGLFLAQITGENFELKVPDDFVPRSFQKEATET